MTAKTGLTRRGIRYRLLVSVNLVVATAAAILLLWDYNRQVRTYTELVGKALDEEAQTLLPALRVIKRDGEIAIQNHIDAVCGRMRESTSPGHHIVVAWRHGRIQAHAHHRSSAELLQAIEQAESSPGNGDLIVGSARDREMVVYVSEQSDNVLRAARKRVLHRGLDLLGLFAATALIVNLLLLRMVVRPIRALATTVRAIAANEFSAVAPESKTLELHTLARAINEMSDALHRSELERAREMKKAKEIQSQLCRIPDAVPGLRTAHLFRPATGVAGDYFDVLELPDGSWLIVVADVIGHGIPAAMTASILKALLVAAVEHLTDPGEILEFVNERFHRVSLPGDFATAVLIRWEPTSSTITVASAGHDPGLYQELGGTVVDCGSSGIVIGFQQGGAWETVTRSVEDGARLLLFTDGVTETRARDGELFGAGAIARLLASHVDDSPERLMSRLAEALDRHRDGVAQRDDVTVLLIEFGCSSSQPNRP